MGQGCRLLVGDGCVLSHAAGKVGFGIRQGAEVVAVMETAILLVVEMGCVLCAPLCERYAARSSHPVPGDGVIVDNLMGLEEFG
ncbi:hypothetical protein [Microcoleus sp. B7-D4]|uniref:hypothetical protein n=1 Tax=Microcoleus sp. B7-D4 TaxID=2818696 RepID=UPI002FD0DA76